MKIKVRTFRYARAGFLGNNRRNQARRPLITGGVAAASSGRLFSDRHSMLGRSAGWLCRCLLRTEAVPDSSFDSLMEGASK